VEVGLILLVSDGEEETLAVRLVDMVIEAVRVGVLVEAAVLDTVELRVTLPLADLELLIERGGVRLAVEELVAVIVAVVLDVRVSVALSVWEGVTGVAVNEVLGLAVAVAVGVIEGHAQ